MTQKNSMIAYFEELNKIFLSRKNKVFFALNQKEQCNVVNNNKRKEK